MPAPTSTSPGRLAATAATYGRQRLVLATSLVLLIGLAWAYLGSSAASSASGVTGALAHHGAGLHATGDGAGFVWRLVMWSTMAVAMMLPTSLPHIFLFGRYWRAKHSGRGSLAATWAMVGGYLSAWVAFAAAAAWIQSRLEEAQLMTSPGGALRSSLLAAAVVSVAGIYQLTPLKTACLSKCRSPTMLLNTRWREGRAGPFLMGLDDGLFCLGCCWALMLVMFVTGVMNLLWMVALALLMGAEKLVPRGLMLARLTGCALIAAALWVALS